MKQHEEITYWQREAEQFITNKIKPLLYERLYREVKCQALGWEIIASYLKREALNFCGRVIVSLREEGIEWATDLAFWLLMRLEDYLLSLYEQASEREREIFRDLVLEKFPHSHLAKWLEGASK